jgi:hypothetical protein
MRILKWLLAVIASLAIAWFLVFGSIRLPASTISNEEEQEMPDTNYVNDIQIQPRIETKPAIDWILEGKFVLGDTIQGVVDIINISNHPVTILHVQLNERNESNCNYYFENKPRILKTGELTTINVTKPVIITITKPVFFCGYLITIYVTTDSGVIRFKPQQQ